MHPLWKTNPGKLIIGGCGTQVGMVLTCGGLTIILLLGMVCVSLNVLSLGLSQEMAGLATPTAVEAPSSPSEVEPLLEEVDLLLAEVEVLEARANVEATPVPAAPSAVVSAKPVVIANQNGVSLHSGPGTQYEQVSTLPLGQSLEIVGRNLDSTWWLVDRGDGLFAWVSNIVVATANIDNSIPVVTTPSQLAQIVSSGGSSFVAASPTATPTLTPSPTPTLPPGTPTPGAEASRQYVADTLSYQKVKTNLLVPPVSASFSPDGSQIAMTERIKLYTFMTDGAYTDIWLEDNDEMGPIGNVVWSPDGEYIAFVVGFKHKYCPPCRAVGLLHPPEGTITFLKPPREDLDTDMPRWTQDGRLLINAHPGEPADGVAYVYNIYGESQKATGVYVLSSSHEGQKWYPWKPGRIWRAGVSERADSYNSD